MKRALLALVLLGAASSGLALTSITLTMTSTLTFPAANPNTTPIVGGSAAVTATIFIKAPNKETVTLTVQADGANLVSGAGDTIGVGNMTWNAASATWTWTGGTPNPLPFWNAQQGPKALTTSAVTVITGNDGKTGGGGTVTGTVTHNFTFQNSWSYSTGAYTQTLTWTVTAI